MTNSTRRAPAVEFKLGSVDLNQSSAAIRTIINSNDDLLLAAYGYAHAGALNEMGLGNWLVSGSEQRRLIIVVGIHDTDLKEDPPYKSILANFNSLFSHWATNSVPLSRVLVYAVEHWHGKLLASMQSIGSLPSNQFGGENPATFEAMLSYDPNTVVAGSVREALIGSSNATYRAMGGSTSSGAIRNFELDVHVLRGSAPELGELSSKVQSILLKAIALVNEKNSHSAIVTTQLRAMLPSSSGVMPKYSRSTWTLNGI